MTRAKQQFLMNQSGASATEFAMLLPVLLLLLLASMTAFDMIRTAQNVEKVTFTIGDMLSRDRQPLSATKLGNMLTLLRNSVPTSIDGGLRISSIAMENDAFVVRWSRAVGNNVPNTPLDSSIFPEITNGDSVLLTESFVPHAAMVAGFGISDVTFSSKAAYRPRFVSAIPFQ